MAGGGSLQTKVEQQLGISFDNFLKLDYDQQQRIVGRLNENHGEQKEQKVKTKKRKLFGKSK